MKRIYSVDFSRKDTIGRYSSYDVSASSVAGAMKKAHALHKKDRIGNAAVEVTKVELTIIIDA